MRLGAPLPAGLNHRATAVPAVTDEAAGCLDCQFRNSSKIDGVREAVLRPAAAKRTRSNAMAMAQHVGEARDFRCTVRVGFDCMTTLSTGVCY